MREQFRAKWTSKEGREYYYTIVKIGSEVVRIFNSFDKTINKNSEVFEYFKVFDNN